MSNEDTMLHEDTKLYEAIALYEGVTLHEGPELHEGTFPRLDGKMKYFYFDECLREGVSEEARREALKEIYQSILKKNLGRYRPESIVNLKIAIVSSLRRDVKNIREVAKILGCYYKNLARYIPQELKSMSYFSIYAKERKKSADEKFLNTLSNVGTCFYEYLSKRLKLSRGVVGNRAKKLEAECLIKITNIPAISIKHSKYGATRLFGEELAGRGSPRRIVWDIKNPEHKKNMIEIFKKGILISEPLSRGKRKALTQYIKDNYPEFFQELYGWYTQPETIAISEILSGER